ncbi:MAG: hypothetical protein ACO3YY_03785, partial [Phycisphaerales bacterium]
MSTQQIARASRFASVVPIAAFTLVVWCFGPRASALDTNETIPADSRVVSASIHAGASAATVTRAAVVEIGEGLSVVRFTGLSPSIDRRTLQAGA